MSISAKFRTVILYFLASIYALCFQEIHAANIQNTDARSTVSLDGDWHIIVDPFENGYYNHRYEEKSNGYFKNTKIQSPSDLVEYDFSLSPTLSVPGDWNSQSEALFWYEGTIWYQKNFKLETQTDKQYFLYFGAVNYHATVYVNGNKAGTHEGGFTPFQFNVGHMLADGDNFVVVKVDNKRAREQVPTVNTDWWNYGGITRSVKLISVPKVYIEDYALSYNSEGNIEGWVQLKGEGKFAEEPVQLNIPELNINKTLITDKFGKGSFSIAAQPTLWEPKNPRRYLVEITHQNTSITDLVGFRTISVQGENIFLNGKSIFLKGISLHEEAPDREGRAWSKQDARKTLKWAKELGCNFVRLAHYPHNETMVKMAEEMGLMVWSEIPVYWTIQFDNSQVYNNAEAQLSAMINRDKNRAAVILWSVANETPNHQDRFEFLQKLVKKARQLDKTRLITAALDTQTDKGGEKVIDDPFAALVDVIGINTYCGWYSGKPESCSHLSWHSPYDKPVIISEFGAGALAGKHGEVNERWTEEYQAAVYENNLAMIKNMSFVRGLTPWILKDFRSPRRPLPQIQDYWNRKGLLNEKGERKLAWKVLHNYYDSVTTTE